MAQNMEKSLEEPRHRLRRAHRRLLNLGTKFLNLVVVLLPKLISFQKKQIKALA